MHKTHLLPILGLTYWALLAGTTPVQLETINFMGESIDSSGAPSMPRESQEFGHLACSTVATPEPFVVVVAPVMLPPPEATAKFTVTPLIPAPVADVTRTLGKVDTAAAIAPTCEVGDTATTAVGVMTVVLGLVGGSLLEAPHAARAMRSVQLRQKRMGGRS